MERDCCVSVNLIEEIKEIAARIPAEFTEKNLFFTITFTVAERKAFLSKKKLVYTAKFSVSDISREIFFHEHLKETGFGISSDLDTSAGFGFKAEKFRITSEGREGEIKEQSDLFGKKYKYDFDLSMIREAVKQKAVQSGYTFKYKNI